MYRELILWPLVALQAAFELFDVNKSGSLEVVSTRNALPMGSGMPCLQMALLSHYGERHINLAARHCDG